MCRPLRVFAELDPYAESRFFPRNPASPPHVTAGLTGPLATRRQSYIRTKPRRTRDPRRIEAWGKGGRDMYFYFVRQIVYAINFISI